MINIFITNQYTIFKMIDLLVIDDHPVVISGLRNLLRPSHGGVRIAASANDIEEAIQVSPDSFHVILLDLWLEDKDPEKNLMSINRVFPGKPVVIMTYEKSMIWQQRMFKLGVKGYIHKSASRSEIIRTLTRVMSGETVFTDDINKYQSAGIKTGELKETGLTQSQKKIIGLLSQGIPVKEIAIKTNYSVSSVEKYIQKLRLRFNAQSNIELVRIWLSRK